MKKTSKLALAVITAVTLGTTLTAPIATYANELGGQPIIHTVNDASEHGEFNTNARSTLSWRMTWGVSGTQFVVTAQSLNNRTAVRAGSNGVWAGWANQASIASSPSSWGSLAQTSARAR